MDQQTIDLFWSRVDKRGEGECWPWVGGIDTGGYGHATFFGASFQAHRLAWEFAHGQIPASMLICHTCDNPPCCNPNHLFLGTPADNMRDMQKKGRGVKISNPYTEMLQEFRARREYVKMQFASGRTVKEIADELVGVTRQRVYAMLGGIKSTAQKTIIDEGVKDGSAQVRKTE